MLTDRRVVALIISFAMLASTFYVGPAFAAENTDSTDSDVNAEYTVPEEGLQEEPAGDGEEVLEPEEGPDQDAQGMEESTEPETEPEAEPEAEETEAVQEETEAEDPTVQLMASAKSRQTIRVVVALSSTKRVLLKPDASGTYTLKTSVSKIRNSKKIRIMISNPAECPLTYSKQSVASNIGGSFLDTSFVGCTINSPGKIKLMSDTMEEAGVEMVEAEPILEGEGGEGGEEPGSGDEPGVEPGDEPGGGDEPGVEPGGGDDPDPGQDEPVIGPDDVQVTEVAVRVNGTGEAKFYFSAKAGTDFTSAKGRIVIKQTRPTSVLSRTAKVRTKTGKPKTIPRKYKERYFKIVKKGDNEKALYKYRKVTAPFEIKRASGISESGYRANQGGGTDGTYSYNCLCKIGSKTYVKIVKTRLRDMKVVKVSKDLKLNHANDVTYDPVHKRLVVTHNDVKRKRVTFVNTRTLKSMGYKDIKIPSTLKGATKKQLSAIKGFASVTYMRGGKYAGNYIGVISGNHNFLVLNKKFKPIEYITVDKKINGAQIYYQGADNIGDKLYIAVYPRKKSRRDFIVAYDMDGNFLGKINLRKGYETENIFHTKKYMYMTLYKPVTKVWYTAEPVEKKVKLTKKERLLAKKNKDGKKPKYKTVIKIVKVKHTKSVKRSFIFRMNKVTL